MRIVPIGDEVVLGRSSTWGRARDMGAAPTALRTAFSRERSIQEELFRVTVSSIQYRNNPRDEMQLILG
jgi:hypothetical protein